MILFAEIIPIDPEIPGSVIEAILGGLLSFLASIFAPVRSAIFAAVKWVYHELYRWVQFVDQTYSSVFMRVFQSLVDLQNRIDAMVYGAVGATSADIGYAISVSEDLYNRAVDQINGAEGYVIGVAEDLYNRAIAAINGAQGYDISVAEDLYNRAIDAVNAARDYSISVAGQWVVGAIAHADAAVAQVAAQDRDLVNSALDQLSQVGSRLGSYVDAKTAAVAAAAAATTAAAVQTLAGTVAATYDPCCEFLTNNVRPQWDAVKGILGKLTNRGPLLFVVLGAASEAITSMDRDAIVKGLIQARKDVGDGPVRELLTWAGR